MDSRLGNVLYDVNEFNTTIFEDLFDWYMIRNESLGPNYGFAVVSLLIVVGMIIYDKYTRKRLDYVWSFISGTILRIGIELLFIYTETVEYQEGILLGKPLPEWLAVFLRCSQEGGALLVIALFEGDRVFDCLKGKQKRPSTCRRWTEFLVVFIVLSSVSFYSVYKNHQDQQVFASTDVCSRRLMTEMSLVLVFIAISLASILLLLLWRRKQYVLRRSLGILIFTTWTIVFTYCIEYIYKTRWIEVGYYPEVLVIPSSGQTLLAFLYSILTEAILPVVCMYQLMVLVFILPDLSKDGYFSLPIGKEMLIYAKPPVSL